jgi:transposase/IS5 family transposase
MAKYKRYDYRQTVLLPVSLEEQLMPGTLEFAIHTLVETRLDMSRFAERFCNDETGRTAYDPKILLKIVLLAYARGMISSRKIERACRENVVFMALTCGQHPDHSTIAAFVATMQEEIQPLFRDVLLVCDELGLLGGTEFALDGCKLPGNASKRWSGTFSVLQEKQGKLERRVAQLLEEQVVTDSTEDNDSADMTSRTKQVEQLQKQAERIERFLQEHEAKPGKQRQEVRSNITDNESAMMHSAHGMIQGYNAQALVDAKQQVIVQGEALGWGQDHYHVEPLIDGAKENLVAIGHAEDYFAEAILTADTAYHSTESIKKCEDEKIDAYIPDKDFRKRAPRFSVQKRSTAQRRKQFSREDFQYDEPGDQYICPNGKRLILQTSKAKASGIIYRRYYAQAQDCMACTLRQGCINKKGAGKRKTLMIPVATEGRNYSKEMAAKIDTEQGRKIYPRRAAIVEPVFANICTHKGLHRFTLRGKIKVTIQWLLYCMVHNIEKIAHFGYDFAPG